ncbi:hypothetical protein VMCG_04698 [Cytospora schulzeri]|uniref:Eisosome protein 1 n=1 Tax=Cytospora schulzeri TaxID=448051 RepID=A0A423WS19_9PEZI|nr:hypothetical protein VMCG_04698 [Valsa malicola]
MAYVSSATQTATNALQSPNDEQKPSSLTSPAHSGRLKYANAEDLPSYPSLGLKKGDAAASAAASLGWANQKPVNLWTPENSTSAHKAANLATDIEMPGALQPPERSTPGPKTAATLAAGSPSRPERPSSSASSAWGNSAANQAFANSGGLTSTTEPPSMSSLDRQKSLRAAKGAMAGGGRQRAISSPLSYPDSSNAAANALNAATAAHRPNSVIKGNDMGTSPITKMDRQMYTSNPPVKAEVDEKDREAVLHASAVAMAKKMYGQQRTLYDAAKQTQGEGRSGSRADSSDSDEVRPMQFGNLQEQAYKLAQERLARLHDDHQKHRDYQDYYATPAPSSPGRKLTRLGQLRRRSSSDGDMMSSPYNDDQKRSRNIQKQMSIFSNRLSEVDEAKRSRDREALLAAAQRNVKATLEGIDEKMYRETGRVAPAKVNDWESKAHTAAQVRSEARKGPDVSGKVNLGGGAYMDQEEVDAVAARHVQPILDDINERAEIERQKVEAQKEEQEKKRLQLEADKERNAHNKEEQRKFKEEEKARKEELKHEAKVRKEEEKAAKAEEKRLAKEEQIANDTAFEEEAAEKRRSRLLPFTHKLQTKDTTPAVNNANNESSPLSPTSTTTPDSAGTDNHGSKVKNWLKLRLHKPRAKSISFSNKSNGSGGKPEKSPGFVGGHRLTGRHPDGTGSMTSLGEARSASMTEVALAGTKSTTTTAPPVQDEPGESSTRVKEETPPQSGDAAVSSASSDYADDAGPAAWDAMRNMDNANKGGLSPPAAASDISNRDSKFIEIIE